MTITYLLEKGALTPKSLANIESKYFIFQNKLMSEKICYVLISICSNILAVKNLFQIKMKLVSKQKNGKSIWILNLSLVNSKLGGINAGYVVSHHEEV